MEENFIFNDPLNTFYLWLYGIRQPFSMRGNLLLPLTGLFFFFMLPPIDRKAPTTAIATPMKHWLE